MVQLDTIASTVTRIRHLQVPIILVSTLSLVHMPWYRKQWKLQSVPGLTLVEYVLEFWKEEDYFMVRAAVPLAASLARAAVPLAVSLARAAVPLAVSLARAVVPLAVSPVRAAVIKQSIYILNL